MRAAGRLRPGTDNIKALRTRADALPEQVWQRLHRPAPYENKTGATRARRHNRKQEVVAERGYLNLRLNYEDVAEFTYRPGKCKRDYRVVVVRKNISRIRGEQALIDEIRYFFYFTTYPATTHTPTQIVELAKDRCDQENIHGQLKSGLAALRAPVDDLHSNWAYMLIAALAWNIKSWHATMMHRKEDRHTFNPERLPTPRRPPTGRGSPPSVQRPPANRPGAPRPMALHPLRPNRFYLKGQSDVG
jgi:hypothetical protein